MLDKILDRLRLVDASSQADADKSLRRMSGPARQAGRRPARALPAAEEIQRREQAMLDHVRAGGSLFDALDPAPVRAATGPAVWSPNAAYGTSTNTAASMYYQ